MYKQNQTTCLEVSKRIVLWVKRKIMLIIAAFMLGFYNVIQEEDIMLHGNANHIEQEQTQDSEDDLLSW